eukprot:scaffold14494_cov221-Amphora_coffeaeformis.AAC.1
MGPSLIVSTTAAPCAIRSPLTSALLMPVMSTVACSTNSRTHTSSPNIPPLAPPSTRLPRVSR